jgi:dihydroorotate dehydrogenase
VAKIRAGATLVQLYSGLVFRGLALVGEIKTEIAASLRRVGQADLDDLVGADAAAMTAEHWPA